MTKQPNTEPPKVPGYYVCWREHSDAPVVIYWAALSTQWRMGAQVQRVTHWLGPLPC